jgi:hypothetical protein
MLRILAFILLLLSVLFMPIYISALLCLLFMIYFSKFWEGTTAFLFSDLLHQVKDNKTFPILFLSFIISLLLLLTLEFLKKKFNFYQR